METWKNKHGEELPDGPWQDEPDKAHWVDEATELDCLIHRNRMGALCGYVGVPSTHPAFEKGYDEVDVDVHGGLSYANKCQETGDPAEGICHVPLPGRTDDVWWLGFDAAHAFDVMPKMPDYGIDLDVLDMAYRTFGYVRGEVESLARQLAEMTV